ncbi:cellulase family glycosylhydrolase [Mucilaginibacter sp. HMF7410]|uniref:Arabinogalactan endo-beta-1,4-galactanase n=2 Tax=Mucilaginibacter arboris TaxID=2682090 RepID=A0A7K1SVT1_9SPHI|nr:cellulase family glycosylhydrolase [Mucilaginibacter arboris]
MIMKKLVLIGILFLSTFFLASAQNKIDTSAATEIVVMPYQTTIIADGKAKALIVISVIDKQGNAVTNASNTIELSVSGDAALLFADQKSSRNSTPAKTLTGKLSQGKLNVYVQSGRDTSLIKFQAKGEKLITGSTEIRTVQPGIPHPVTTVAPIAGNAKFGQKILGADISFLPQLEARGMKFYNENGKQEDVLKILKDHGFNYIRLRLFDHPENAKGYSPNKGFCDLPHTLAMAKRIKAAGMKFLLDFHYSDTWADPQRQDKPIAWQNLNFTTLKDSVFTYTKSVMQTLKDQGTEPDLVQVGNEINHGMLWPDGEINNLDSLAQFIFSGIKAVKAVSPSTPIMLHIALGGQNLEARFFIDNMLKRKVPFDVIGLSYYPKWHGTLSDLKMNMADLAKRYHKYVMVAEYSQLKEAVNDIAFTAAGDKALGSFIWEPLNTWESFFDRNGKANSFLQVYPAIAKKYNVH